MSAYDQGTKAFHRALTIATGSAVVVAGVAWLLFSLGAFAHLRGMASRLCVTPSHIAGDLASLWLVMLVVSALFMAVLSVLASVAVHRRALHELVAVGGASRRRVSRACRSLGITTRAVVFRSDGVIACSRGVLFPSIWISDRAVASLDDEELAAVLAHEDHHCRRRDPARRQVLEVLSHALFAFPVVREATRAFLRMAEFAADDAASKVTSARATAQALLAFASTAGEPSMVQFGSSTTIGERVQRLIGLVPAASPSDRGAGVRSALTIVFAAACLVAIALLPTM